MSLITASGSRLHGWTPPVASGALLVSRGQTATASGSDGLTPPSYAVDSDYNTVWFGAGGSPYWLSIDITGLGLGWTAFSWLTNNDNFTAGVAGQSVANAPGDYTIQADFGSGFTTVKTVVDSLWSARIDLVDLTGATSVRIHVTQGADGGTSAPQIQVDLWDVSAVITAGHDKLTCGVFTAGDSITGIGLPLRSDYRTDSHSCFGDQMFSATGRRSIQVCAGNFGSTAADVEPLMDGYLSVNVCKWVTINLGTNDAVHSTDPADFYTAMASMVQKVIDADLVPVVPTIPWCRLNSATPYNDKIALLKIAYPAILAGPDLYAYFNANQSLISGDDVHPTSTGFVSMLTQWVNWAVAAGVG